MYTLGLMCFTTGNILMISSSKKVNRFFESNKYSLNSICIPVFKQNDLKQKINII